VGAASEGSEVLMMIEASYVPREVQDTQAVNVLLVLGWDSDTKKIRYEVGNAARFDEGTSKTYRWTVLLT
jgi:hypothetical protein